MNTKLYTLTRDVNFTLTALKAKESLFPPYLKEQMEVVNNFYTTYDQLKKRAETVTRDRRSGKKGIDTVSENAAQLIRKIAFTVKTDHPEDYKKYFPVNYSVAVRSKKSLLKAYAVILSELNIDPLPALIPLKDEIEAIYQTLQDETDRVTDAVTDHKLLQEEIDQLYSSWSLEYKRLRMMVEMVLLGKETDYRIFFKPRASKKGKDKTTFDQPVLPASTTK